MYAVGKENPYRKKSNGRSDRKWGYFYGKIYVRKSAYLSPGIHNCLPFDRDVPNPLSYATRMADYQRY